MIYRRRELGDMGDVHMNVFFDIIIPDDHNPNKNRVHEIFSSKII